MNSPPSLPQLFLAFLRLGLTAFGGPSRVAYIRKLAVERQQWLDEETFRASVALCQTLPGATAMQAAAYVGLRLRGTSGAGVSTIGFGLPAFLLMLALSALYASYWLYGLLGNFVATVSIFLPLAASQVHASVSPQPVRWVPRPG